MLELLEKLKTEGGAIVASKECSAMEIAFAKSQGNMFIDQDGCGFVLRSQEWLDAIKQVSGVLLLAGLAELLDA